MANVMAAVWRQGIRGYRNNLILPQNASLDASWAKYIFPYRAFMAISLKLLLLNST